MVALALAGEPGLVWPLEFDDGLSSSFGELRGDRLHTGIDLKTHGVTGAAVHAADDGAVIRLKEQWRGYGLAVYVEHPNGLVTVYGHLDRVRADLADIIEKRRAKRGRRWAGDITVSPPRAVQRGETIAWSGESGAGLPHLHFEVRRGMGQPIDPFAAGLAPPRDPEPPFAESLVIEPAAGGSTIDGHAHAVRIPLRRHGDDWVADARPSVAGPFRLLLRAYDTVGAKNRAGLGGLRTRVDGQTIYELRFDSIPFGRNQTSGVVLDLGRSHMSPTWYTYRLTGLDGGQVPFASGAFEPLTLAPGPHRLEVDLADAVAALGYRTSIRIELEVSARPDLAAAAIPSAQPGKVLRTTVEARADGVQIAAVLDDAGDEAIGAHIDERALTLRRGVGATYSTWLTEPPLGEVELVIGERRERVAFARLSPGSAARMTLGAARLSVDRGAAWAQAWVVARDVAVDLPDGMRAVAAAIDLGPDGHPFRAPVAIEFDGTWSFLDVGARAEIRRLGVYALLQDRSAPTIVAVTPADGARVASGRVEFTIAVADVGSGIPERGVVVQLDGRRIDERYDPDRQIVRASASMIAGEHDLQITVSDWAGNSSSWSGSIATEP